MDVTIEIDKEYEELRKSFKFSNRKICDIDVGEELWHYKESSNDLEVQFEQYPYQHYYINYFSTKYNSLNFSWI